MSAFTPGPWKAMNNNAGFLYDFGVVQDDGGNQYAHKIIAVAHDDEDDDWEANSVLIAAAPDLLTACETMLAGADDGNPFAAGMIVAAVEMMQAAVAKARGTEGPS